MKVAEVTAHAMYFQVPLFLYHQQVDGAGGHPGGRPGGPGGTLGPGRSGAPQGPKGTSGSSKNFGGDGELVSSPPSFSGVIS